MKAEVLIGGTIKGLFPPDAICDLPRDFHWQVAVYWIHYLKNDKNQSFNRIISKLSNIIQDIGLANVFFLNSENASPKMVESKWYHQKVLLKSFPRNDHASTFRKS
jgi:hypothetical protein